MAKKSVLLCVILLTAALFAFGCGEGGNEADVQGDTVTITDMAGRVVEIPSQVNKVYTSGQVATIMLYCLDPDKLLGWNYELNDLEKEFILEEYRDLTAYGTGDSVNYEAVLAADPELIVIAGTINDGEIENADKLQAQLNIPVVLLNGDLEASAGVLQFFGQLIGNEERGAELAAYADQVFDWLEAAVAAVPEEEKVTVYYGNGEQSLNTAAAGSASSQVLDMIGAVNVAQLETGSGNRIDVSKEQILAWDPQVVILNGEPKQDMSSKDAVTAFAADPDLASLQAVKESRIYGSPKAPFSWIDRPPGPNRLIGLYWAYSIVYPEYTDYNVDEKVREFYRLFYHMELTDDQLHTLFTV